MEFERAEYEIQHFNFSVEQIQLEHRLMVEKQVGILAEQVAESLIKKSNTSAATADNIRSRSKIVAQKIMPTIENGLRKFDSLLEKHFSIPHNILLAEDLRHEDPCTRSDEEYYKDRVAEMERTFKQNKYLLSSLGAELRAYGELAPALELESEVMKKVEDSFKTNLNFNDVKTIVKKVNDVQMLKEEKEVNRGK